MGVAHCLLRHLGRVRGRVLHPGLIMGAALRYFRDDVEREDLTGCHVPLWHESMQPWTEPQSKPVPVPDKLRAQLKAIKASKTMQRGAMASSEAIWLDMSEQTRAILIMLCTTRPSNTAGNVSWRDLTEAEREAVGLQVRSFARECGRAMVTGLK
jgi:hypothetical protein